MGTSSDFKTTVRHDSDSIVLSMLDAIARNPNVTQRYVARELGIAVGLANTYVKRCVRKGFVKISQAPAGRYLYYVTPKGFSEKSRLTASFLTNSFSLFRRAREQCDALLQEMVAKNRTRIVLLGGGDLAEIVRLLAPGHCIKIVALVSADNDNDNDNDIDTVLRSLPDADQYIVTSFDRGSEFLEIAIARFGADRVIAPAILRLSSPTAEQSTFDGLDADIVKAQSRRGK